MEFTTFTDLIDFTTDITIIQVSIHKPGSYTLIFFVYYTMPKKVPQRRNKRAGKSTGKSRSAKYFAKNPEARAKKNAYNTKYHSSTKRKKYRAKLNKANRDNPNGNKDKSHTKGGKLVNESRSKNRARNGKGGKSSKK